MDYTAFIDLNSLTGEAKKELESFYEYLIFKYKKKIKRKPDEENKKEKFEKFANNHLINLPENFKFNRDEAHER